MDYIDVWREFCKNDPTSGIVRLYFEDMDREPEWIEAVALGEQMLLGYHEHWGGDPDWDVVNTEEAFQIQIPSPLDNDDIVAIFCSTFDGVYWDRRLKQFRLMEHKTAAAVQTGYLDQDDQGGAYWAVADQVLHHKGILEAKQHISGIEYNFLRKAKPDDRPRNDDGMALNKDGSVSKNQPAPLFVRKPVKRTPKQQRIQIGRIGSEVAAMNMFRSGALKLYKNPTRDCSWDCSFYEMCKLHDSGADWKEFRAIAYNVQDPYADHRKSASG